MRNVVSTPAGHRVQIPGPTVGGVTMYLWELILGTAHRLREEVATARDLFIVVYILNQSLLFKPM